MNKHQECSRTSAKSQVNLVRLHLVNAGEGRSNVLLKGMRKVRAVKIAICLGNPSVREGEESATEK